MQQRHMAEACESALAETEVVPVDASTEPVEVVGSGSEADSQHEDEADGDG